MTSLLGIGTGKLLFAERTEPKHFKLVDSVITRTGAIIELTNQLLSSKRHQNELSVRNS